MARYRHSYGSHRAQVRKWLYAILSAVVIVAAIAFVGSYNFFGKNKDKAVPSSTYNETGSQAVPEEQMTTQQLVATSQPDWPAALTTVSSPNPKAVQLIEKAEEYINASPAQIIDARQILNRVLIMPLSSQQRVFVKDLLSRLAQKWLFSRTVFPQDNLCNSYKVQPGNQLRTIGQQFKVPYEILLEINRIRRPEALQAGEVIKVINGPFHARISRSTFTMDLYLQNTYVQSFPVGLGKPGRLTPTGLWLVEEGGKLIKPAWTDPDTGRTYNAEDPDYPLGSRWIGLEGIDGDAVGREGIAFHGTNDPNYIGTMGSRGCIRLHNGDAILIYNLLTPGYSQVKIVE